MPKLILLLMLLAMLNYASAQTPRNAALFVESNYSQTLSDITKGNNPWLLGVGLQLFLSQKSIFKPSVELTASMNMMDDKVYRTYNDGTPIPTVGGMVNVFAGISVHPLQKMYLSFLAGPSFVGRQAHFGVKPSVGFYFPSNQKFLAKISYLNILNRDLRTKQDFSALSLSLGYKLF